MSIPGDELRQNVTPILFEYTNVPITTDNRRASCLHKGLTVTPSFNLGAEVTRHLCTVQAGSPCLRQKAVHADSFD